jgi:predicted  nucleic acid-binding Zn-ribbon protein
MLVFLSACASVLGVLLFVASLFLLRTRKELVKERAASTSFRERFPPTLVNVDAEVERLRGERAALENAIVAARSQAAAERDRDQALFAEQRRSSEREEKTRRDTWESRFTEAMGELDRLHGEVESLTDEAEMQSFGLYKPRYQFATSDKYREKLDDVRSLQKLMLKGGKKTISASGSDVEEVMQRLGSRVALARKPAASCSRQWEVAGSASEGRKMVERQLKLMLRAFNGECEAATANATWKNVVTLRERIRKSFDAINVLGETVSCRIEEDFLQLRLDELELAYEYAEKVHAEKEEQRELREQMREEEKALKEIEREKEDAEKEGDRHQKALEKARAEMERANAGERAALDSKIEKLEKLLLNAEDRKQRAISQAELTRRGHVYILSNEGAFGSNVFKIGMTRRLDPQDRVDELGSASVPFRFDVHAIIHSEDAPALEQKLHEALEPHRLNLVNHRKEYFRVPLEKVIDLVTMHHGAIQLTRTAEAAEYRKSLAIRAEREAMVAGKAAHASAVSRAGQVSARFEKLKKATA